MPANQAQEYLRECDERDDREAKAAHIVRNECADAMELMVGAIRRPAIARADLEEALIHLNRALSAAAVLDPEEI